MTDAESFIDLINSPGTEARDLFSPDTDIFVARAPGRLDVMGGIADYSGSVVLEMPIAEATLCAVQKSNDRRLRIISINADATLDFHVDLSELQKSYDDVRTFFSRDITTHWASYIAGVFTVLAHEKEVKFQDGARILISSNIPVGKGVSSSAALEVATMHAVCAAFGIEIDPLEMALLCQKVENLIVGAPCGMMDQIASHCGVENSLLRIICAWSEIKGSIPVPDETEFWGIDSGVRHAVSGADYTSVRIGAFMGYRIIADLKGLPVRRIGDGLVEVDDPGFHGRLSHIAQKTYEMLYQDVIPREMKGKEFLERYGGITDRVTKIDPETVYPVKAPTEHPIMESMRVLGFYIRLKHRSQPNWQEELGERMFRSHESYRACGLTEPGTERLVELVKENLDRGLYGGRITGGGSGGTVAVAARAGSRAVIEEIATRYEEETGRKPYIFHGSSPGCAAFGILRLSPLNIER